MVFYRKYRPQKIEELDKPELRESLTSVLSKETVPHAFLFTGPKGLGKTSAARIVAKAINCEAHSTINKGQKEKVLSSKSKIQSVQDIEPCNQCSQCISITNGSNLDILEIDGASNRGIDEIRDLREKIKLLPVSAKTKVYIIDEVHMLTPDAFNALLKTLEEPPPHAVFILCTTESHKVPATIVSRCFRIQFSIATSDELLRSFSRIVKGEHISIEEDALLTIARLSEGSFRDGAKILEEIVAFSQKEKITKEFIEERYHISNLSQYVDTMLEYLSKHNRQKALVLLQEITEKGISEKVFIEKILEKLHECLLIQTGVWEKKDVPFTFSLLEIKELAEYLLKAYSQVKYAIFPQLPLELAIIDFAKNSLDETPKAVVQTPNQTSAKTYVQSEITLDLKETWYKLIDNIKLKSFSLGGILRGCSLYALTDTECIIHTTFQFHKDKLHDNKFLTILEEGLKEVTGKNLKVIVELKSS